jgi:hypothetical protein
MLQKALPRLTIDRKTRSDFKAGDSGKPRRIKGFVLKTFFSAGGDFFSFKRVFGGNARKIWSCGAPKKNEKNWFDCVGGAEGRRSYEKILINEERRRLSKP